MRRIPAPAGRARFQGDAIQMIFARTKIQPPRFRVGLIERSELERQFAAALLNHRLVLLVAPAGYGKTAALSRQLSLLPPECAIAWVKADSEDDLERLLSYLLEALEPCDPPWRVAPEALIGLVATESGLREAAVVVGSTLAATDVKRGVIVLDDLHSVADPRVCDFLALLLDDLPENWTIAIATRVDPRLPLARLRAQRELAEFRQAELSFSMREVQRLCIASGGEDRPEFTQRLYERTQGWAAGLSLSLDAMSGSAAAAPTAGKRSQRHLFDYLASEVLQQMPEELHDFLLRCAVLPELTVQACAEVSGNPRAAELLEDIDRRGLFVSALEGEQLTLRLHDLFRDFLDERLRREFPDEMPELLRRAAACERDPVRKVNLLLKAGAWDEAEQVFIDAASPMLASGDSAQVVRLIEQFPPLLRARSPQLTYATGLCELQNLEFAKMQIAMNRAAAGFESLQQDHEAQHARAFETLALFFAGRTEEMHRLSKAIRARPLDETSAAVTELVRIWESCVDGPPEGPAEHLDRLIDILSKAATPDLWYCCAPNLYVFVGRTDFRAPLQRFVRSALAVAGDTNAALQAAAHTLEAWLEMGQGRLAQADAKIRQLREDNQWLGQPRSLRVPLLRLETIYQALQGDTAALGASCAALLEDGQERTRGLNWGLMQISLAGRAAAAVGDWDGVREAERAFARMPKTFRWPLHMPIIRSFEGLLALRDQRDEEALKLLREAAAKSADVDRIGINAFCRIHLARAELRCGSPANAWQAVAPLLEHERRTGELIGVLLTGVSALTELANAAWAAEVPVHGVAAVRRWADTARQLRRVEVVAPAPKTSEASALLSDRELEVLARVAVGESNKLIARALNLSPHTVKRHLARILERLEMSSRGEAADWYRTHLGPLRHRH
jgi:LuxR family maltose regulon positive regulatory protein